MAEGKKSFILYTDQYNFIKVLPDELAGQLFKHIYKYVNDENPPEPENLAIQVAWAGIKESLKDDLKKYEAQVSRIKANGKQYQKEKTNVEPISNQSRNEVGGVNDNVNVNDNELSKDNNINITFNKLNVHQNDVLDAPKKAFHQDLFDAFWKAYPKKVEKQKCINWFKSHKPDKALVNKMLQAIENYKKTDAVKRGFIKNPLTWLHGGCWDDEALETKSQYDLGENGGFKEL